MATQQSKITDLGKRIIFFIEKYAGISPNYDKAVDQYEDRFTGPDSALLWYTGNLIKDGILPDTIPFSSWGSGCYKPYSSKEGRDEHDFLLAEIEKLIK